MAVPCEALGMVDAAVGVQTVEAKLAAVRPQSVASAKTARAAPIAQALAWLARGRLAAAGRLQYYTPEMLAALKTPAASRAAYP